MLLGLGRSPRAILVTLLRIKLGALTWMISPDKSLTAVLPFQNLSGEPELLASPVASPRSTTQAAPTAAPDQYEFARDSSLEGRVSCELVSEPKFPGNREKYRDFHRRSLRVRLVARNPEPNSVIYDPIPYASEQGSYFGLAGN
jgi:hypothetical protein